MKHIIIIIMLITLSFSAFGAVDFGGDIAYTPAVSNLDDLDDVSIISVSNGQVIAYNTTSGQWENYNVANLTAPEVDPLSLHKDGTVQLTGDWDYGSYNIEGTGNIETTTGNISSKRTKTGKLYLGDGGNPQDYYYWLQERPSLSNNRIMIYGLADAGNAFGYVISPSDITGKDNYANLWDRDFDNALVVDGYYAGTQLDTSEGGNMRLFTGVKSGTSYTAGDIKVSPNYWTNGDLATFYEDDYIEFDGNLTVKSKISAADSLSAYRNEVIMEPYTDTWGPSGAIRYYGAGWDAAGWEMQYGSYGLVNLYNNMAGGFSFEGGGYVMDDPYLTTQPSSSQDLRLAADGGDVVMNDNMRMSFGTGSGYIANRPRDAAIYYTTSGKDGLYIDPNRINADDELVIDGDIYIRSANNDDRAFSLQQDRNVGIGFNTGVFIESRVNDTSSASGSLAAITGGVYKKGVADLTSEYAMTGVNNFVDLNYFSGSSGDITGAMSQQIILLENSDNYNGTVDKYSGSLYRTNAAGGGQVNVTDFSYIRMLSSDRPSATNNTGIIIGDITGAENNYAMQIGLGQSVFEDDITINGMLYVNEINASSGSLKIYNSTGWGTIEVGNITTHTIVDDSMDALEYFQTGDKYLNPDGSINHEAFGELHTTSIIRDFSSPKYTYEIKEVCELVPERKTRNVTDCNVHRIFKGINKTDEKNPKPIYEDVEKCTTDEEYYYVDKIQCQNVTDVSVTYPEIEVEGILLNGQVAKLSQAMGLLNQNIDLYENLTDFDTGIMAEDMFFQSKAVSPDVDYVSIFSDIVPFTEKHKSKYTTNLTLPDKGIVQADNVEDQIKDLQGYILQNEFCRKNNKKWDDYNTCMDNGETLGQKK